MGEGTSQNDVNQPTNQPKTMGLREKNMETTFPETKSLPLKIQGPVGPALVM